MFTKNWWQSKTIWSTLIAALAGLVTLTGHTIEPGTQGQLVEGLSDVANGVGIIASLAAAYYRTKAVTTIAPTPAQPPAA